MESCINEQFKREVNVLVLKVSRQFHKWFCNLYEFVICSFWQISKFSGLMSGS